MSESANRTATLDAPPSPNPQAAATGVQQSLLGRLGRIVPPLFVFTALGGLLLWGHHTGWTLPKFSSLAGNADAGKDDWCSEHGVPESQCVECNPALLPRPKAFGWCKLHGVHECPLCHPEVAQLKTLPQITAADLRQGEAGAGLCGTAREQQQVQAAPAPHPVHLPGGRPEGGHRGRAGLDGPGGRGRPRATARSPTTRPARPGCRPVFPARCSGSTSRWATR